MVTPAQVVGYWRDAGPGKWFGRDEAFDGAFRERFETAHFAASRGEHDAWASTAEGALALLVLLDQFPRNCFRGSAHSYATDGLARRHARNAIEAGFDLQVEAALRLFFYLPFEHSEAMPDQDYAVQLIAGTGNQELMKFAVLHRDLIADFGRFPHRNAALRRESTPEELDYLANGGFSG